jgi:hypothetical protein
MLIIAASPVPQQPAKPRTIVRRRQFRHYQQSVEQFLSFTAGFTEILFI